MLKVEGGVDIIARKLRAKFFDNAHISPKPRPFFCINEALGQTGKDLLAVERAVSQPEDSL